MYHPCPILKILKCIFSKNKSPCNLQELSFSYSVVGVPTFFFTCWSDHTSRAGCLPLKFRLLLLCRNALDHFVHWRLPLFLFLNEVPLRKGLNHFSITSLSILHPTSRRLGLRVRRSFSLRFSFAFWSYTCHFCTSRLSLRCFSTTALLCAFWPLAEFRQILLAIRLVNLFPCVFSLAVRLPKTRRLSLDLALGYLRWLPTSLWLPRGIYSVASLWEGIIAFRTLLFFFPLPRPCGSLPSPDGYPLYLHRFALHTIFYESLKHFLSLSFICTLIIA